MNTQTDHIDKALPNGAQPPRHLRWLPVRRLGNHHRGRVLEHLLALDGQDRQLRFAHVASDEQIARYAEHLDFGRDEIFGVFDDQLVLVAMAHLAFDADGKTPEFGVSVHPRLRGRGIGGRLFHHAVTHARNCGAGEIAIHIARENSAMLAIVRRAGARIDFAGADAVAQLGLPADTLGSQLEEMVERQAANIDYRIKLQVLRLDRLFTGLLHGRRIDD
ncbi:MAG: GNAT family N-acetyltransferase [Rubrivivax sp.]|nr:GNAT family N-acetyltransferase [Rubrivivax sp.]